jgi:hypothetical protein
VLKKHGPNAANAGSNKEEGGDTEGALSVMQERELRKEARVASSCVTFEGDALFQQDVTLALPFTIGV